MIFKRFSKKNQPKHQNIKQPQSPTSPSKAEMKFPLELILTERLVFSCCSDSGRRLMRPICSKTKFMTECRLESLPSLVADKLEAFLASISASERLPAQWQLNILMLQKLPLVILLQRRSSSSYKIIKFQLVHVGPSWEECKMVN